MIVAIPSLFGIPVPGAASPPPQRAGDSVRWLQGAGALRLAVLALLVLTVGIAVSAATTTDPLWWHLHFSRLGTFHNASGAVFNGTLVAAGAVIAVFARSAGRELHRLESHLVRRGTGVTARVLFTGVGASLALVGMVPLNSNKLVHDHVTAAMVLSFGALLLSSPWLMHRMPRLLVVTTGVVFIYLFVGGWLFVSATINLALFEVVAFTAMFSWTGVLLACMRRGPRLTPRRDAPDGCSRPAHPAARRTPARRRVPYASRPAARALLRRGCTESAAPQASARWRTPDRR